MMDKYMERAKELRASVDPHYNCAQSVVIPFAEDAGISEEAANRVAANFGSGMKMGSVCGAVTGGLMVLGLLGVNDSASLRTYYRTLKENHQGCLDCADLLRINREQGGDQKAHCDAMVYECIRIVEEILQSR